tara:strand:- start:354 stop:740 length:387 start_codon:yes stop_codon:yes gene_type:complete
MTTENERLAILPITFLAIIYFGRDILRFNKLNIKGFCNINFTASQLRVAFFCYPIWILLVWVENIAQKRHDYFVVITMNVVGTYVAWWTTIAILNDGFNCSNQQIVSLLFSFILSATWRVTNILIFND